MKSILMDSKECLICGSPNVEVHHVMFGPDRKNADKLGLTVYLCPEHHRGNEGPHHNKPFDIALKKEAQREFLKTRAMAEWMEEFGRNYL